MAAEPVRRRIRLRVSRTHYLLSTVQNSQYRFDARVPKAAQKVIMDWGRALCPTLMVVATCRGKVIGFCRAREYERDGQPMVCGCGTWVADKFQRQGIATRLWVTLLKHLPEIKRVYVSTTSDAGAKFFRALREVLPKTMFDIY